MAETPENTRATLRPQHEGGLRVRYGAAALPEPADGLGQVFEVARFVIARIN